MGWSMLHQAAMEGKVDTIQDEIYKKGTLVNDKTELTGSTPLHKACQYGHVRAVEELIKEEADVNAKNDWGCTCLHWTVKGWSHNQNDKNSSTEEYIQIIHLLVQSSKKLLDTKNNAHPGETPLQMAIRLEATEIAAVLEKKTDLLQQERKTAEEKKIRNKPKVRRI